MENRTKASIHTSEVLSIMSKHTNEEYRISVSLPSSYDHKPDISFPATYVVDGNILFEMVTGISRMMQQGRVIPEMVVVSIGYPLEGFYGEDLRQFFVRRGKDFTSVVDCNVWMNGGFFVLSQEFFRYIREGEDLVAEPFQRLIQEKKLCTLQHNGFWSCMDTYKEKQDLDEMYERGDTPWQVWRKILPSPGKTPPPGT